MSEGIIVEYLIKYPGIDGKIWYSDPYADLFTLLSLFHHQYNSGVIVKRIITEEKLNLIDIQNELLRQKKMIDDKLKIIGDLI